MNSWMTNMKQAHKSKDTEESSTHFTECDPVLFLSKIVGRALQVDVVSRQTNSALRRCRGAVHLTLHEIVYTSTGSQRLVIHLVFPNIQNPIPPIYFRVSGTIPFLTLKEPPLPATPYT